MFTLGEEGGWVRGVGDGRFPYCAVETLKSFWFHPYICSFHHGHVCKLTDVLRVMLPHRYLNFNKQFNACVRSDTILIFLRVYIGL